MHRASLTVTGMSCNGCEQTVETALTNLDAVARVDADHTSNTVEVVVNDDVDNDDLRTAIEQAGYDIAT